MFRTRIKKTALHLAAQNGHKEVVRLLFPEANLGHTGNEAKTALYLAAHGGHEEAAQWLTKQRLDPNSQDKQKRTALHLVAQSGHERVLGLLLNNGADPNSKRREFVDSITLCDVEMP
jgi:serine/threonine-protein phosphatase 6 regulatory ankyrin repeat subunit A